MGLLTTIIVVGVGETWTFRRSSLGMDLMYVQVTCGARKAEWFLFFNSPIASRFGQPAGPICVSGN